MATVDELFKQLDNLNRKLDKLTNHIIKVEKRLHLIPVTEDEERAIQIAQRKSYEIATKINNELDVMENKAPVDDANLSVAALYNATPAEIYEDVIGSDFIK